MSKTPQYDYGLAMLRMMMCFTVVLCHFWDAADARGVMRVFRFLRAYAVPVFMILSFIFSQKAFLQHDRQKVKSRFERLIIPQVGWAVMYWVVYILIDRTIGMGLQLGIGDLLWQLFTGHSPKLNAVMWYQFDLILLTALFLVIISHFKDRAEWILLAWGVAALAIQYSKLHLVFLPLRFELRYPLGRFSEMVPLAVVGYLLSSKNVLVRIKSHRLASIVISILTMAVAVRLGNRWEPSGYDYQGAKRIVMGVAFVALFCAIPFERIPELGKKIIKVATSYTLGIYCMHNLVGTLTEKAMSYFGASVPKPQSFAECILIYLIAFAASWLGSKALGRTKFKSLFN